MLLNQTIYYLNKSKSKWISVGLHYPFELASVVKIFGRSKQYVIFKEEEWIQFHEQRENINKCFQISDTMCKPRQNGSKRLMVEIIEEKKISRIEDMCGNKVYLEIQFIKKIGMLYAEPHWTKAIDLKSAVERLYEKLGVLEFDADHEAIYGMERYYTVQQCEEIRDKYKIGRKIISIALFTFVLKAAADTDFTNVVQPRRDTLSYPPPRQQSEELSFMSKIASWILPFSNINEPTVGTVSTDTHRRYATQYLPAPLIQQHCSPCNQGPWIPVTRHQGHNTIIGFLPPPHHSSSTQQYRSPSPYKPISPPYGSSSTQYRPQQVHLPPILHRVPHDQQGYHSHIQPNVKPPPNNIMIPTYFLPPPLSKLKHSHKNVNIYKTPVKHNNEFKYYLTKQKIPTPPQHGPPIPLNYDKPSFVTTQSVSVDLKPPIIDSTILKNYVSPPTNYNLPLEINGNLLRYQISNTKFAANHVQTKHNTLTQNSDFTADNQEMVKNVQLIPSIRIADFVSTIEHPISVIQSPIVDVLTTNNEPLEEQRQIVPNIYGNIKLNQQPIVVEDTLVAATASNSLQDSINALNKNSQFINFNSISPTNTSNVIVPTMKSNVTSNSANRSLPIVQFLDGVPTVESLIEYSKDNNLSWNVEVLKGLHSSEAAAESFLSDSTVMSTENPRATIVIQQPHSTKKSQLHFYHITSGKKTNKNEVISSPLNLKNLHLPSLSIAMIPPPINQAYWQTTKKPKHVQIIIPYKTNNESSGIPAILPMYTQPPSPNMSSLWSNYAFDHTQEGSKQITVTVNTPSSVLSMQELIAKTKLALDGRSDISKLQKNIDNWTQQEFSNTISNLKKSTITSFKFSPSKNIPTEYLTTHPYSTFTESTTSKSIIGTFHKYELNNKVKKKNVESKYTILESTPVPVTLTTTSNMKVTNANLASMIPILSTLPIWKKMQLSISPLTKEKIYVVTPQPWKYIIPKEINEKLFPSTPTSTLSQSKLTVVIKDEGNKTNFDQNGLKVVYSEWPHLINKLMTTTTKEPTSIRQPLHGIMDLTSHTPIPSTTVETYSDHAKVVALVTPFSTKQNETEISKIAYREMDSQAGPSRKCVRFTDPNFEEVVLNWYYEICDNNDSEVSGAETIFSDHNSDSQKDSGDDENIQEDSHEEEEAEEDINSSNNYFYGKNKLRQSKTLITGISGQKPFGVSL
ncbi:hypothetical protein FQA39_LY15987 [Lamprigera yunnana]|nr:hypothetical protein FQA39_LY15987 [Lamprigera yunnana]